MSGEKSATRDDITRRGQTGDNNHTGKLYADVWNSSSYSQSFERGRLDPKLPNTQANVDLQNLLTKSKEQAAPGAKPAVESIPVNQHDRNFGIKTSVVVHYADLNGKPAGDVKFGLNAEGKTVRADFLDKNGAVSKSNAVNDHADSFIKTADGRWKMGNTKTGQWDPLAEQSLDFSTRTGALIRPFDGKIRVEQNINGSEHYTDGSENQIKIMPGADKTKPPGLVTTSPDGKTLVIQCPDQKLTLKYKDVVKNGRTESVLNGFDIAKPTTAPDGTKQWEDVASYKVDPSNPKNFKPDQNNFSSRNSFGEMNNFSVDDTNGIVSYQDRQGSKHVITADGRHYDASKADYKFNASGGLTSVDPTDEAFQKGAVRFSDIKYNSAGKMTSFKGQKQETLEGGNKATKVFDEKNQCSSVTVTNKDGELVCSFQKDYSNGEENIYESRPGKNLDIKLSRKDNEKEWQQFERKNGEWTKKQGVPPVLSANFTHQGLKKWLDKDKNAHTQATDSTEEIKFKDGHYAKKDADGRYTEYGINGKPTLLYKNDGEKVSVLQPIAKADPVEIATIDQDNPGNKIREDGVFEQNIGNERMVIAPNGNKLTYKGQAKLLSEIVLPGGKGKAEVTYRNPAVASSLKSVDYSASSVRARDNKSGKLVTGKLNRTVATEVPVPLANGVSVPSSRESASMTFTTPVPGRPLGRPANREVHTAKLTPEPPPRLMQPKLNQSTGVLEGTSEDGQLKVRISPSDINRAGKDAIRPVAKQPRYEQAVANLRQVFMDNKAQDVMKDLHLPADISQAKLDEISHGLAYALVKNNFPNQFPGRRPGQNLLDPKNRREFVQLSKEQKTRVLELATSFMPPKPVEPKPKINRRRL